MRKNFVIGEFQFAAPAYRTASRLVAIKEDESVWFALEYQHEGEPGAWVEELTFPWHGLNLDSLVCACAQFHDRIQKVINYRKEKNYHCQSL